MELLAKGAAALGVQLDRAQLDLFRRYYQEMVEWNRRANLTAVTAWEQVQTRHFLDSLAVSAVLPAGLLSSGSVVDVGSGAGLPGVPLRIAYPGIRLTLIEATAKKAAFLTHVAQALDLAGVEIRTGRAEALAHDPRLRETYGAVLSRAVAKLPVLAELTLAFCRLGGIVVAQKRPGVEGELQQARRAVETMGGVLKEVREVEVAPDGTVGAGVQGRLATALVVLEKKSPTPDKYPRRPGIPAKRPL